MAGLQSFGGMFSLPGAGPQKVVQARRSLKRLPVKERLDDKPDDKVSQAPKCDKSVFFLSSHDVSAGSTTIMKLATGSPQGGSDRNSARPCLRACTWGFGDEEDKADVERMSAPHLVLADAMGQLDPNMGMAGGCCNRTGTEEEAPPPLTPAALRMVDIIFDHVDKNGDDHIDTAELEALCRAIIQTSAPEHCRLSETSHKGSKRLMKAIDRDPPFGQIGRHELRNFFAVQNVAGNPIFDVSRGLQDVLANIYEELLRLSLGRRVKQTTHECTHEQLSQWFNVKGELGKGQFATVELWQQKEAGSAAIDEEMPELVAAKKFIKKRRPTRKQVYAVVDEFLIMKQLIPSHPNVVQLYHMIDTREATYLLLEYVPGGELYPLVQQMRLSAEDARHISFQILKGLEFIHSNSVIHLDIKPENIMLDQTVGPPYLIKIADFGFSVDHSIGQEQFAGSPMYCSPELLARQSTYDEKVDIWAVGVLLHEMLSGFGPFTGHFRQLRNAVQAFRGFTITTDNVYPVSDMSLAAQNMVDAWDKKLVTITARSAVARMLKPASIDRPTASMMLKDTWYCKEFASRESTIDSI